ncbi:hypothetical protein CRG98_026313, partial [Punica granatum]
GYLTRDGNNGDAVERGVSKAADQVGGPGARSSYAHSRKAGGTGIAFGSENATLLVTGKDIPDSVGAGEGLVDLQGRPSRVCEDVADALPLEGLHDDVGAFAGLVGGKSGDEGGIGGGGRGGGAGTELEEIRRERRRGEESAGWGRRGRVNLRKGLRDLEEAEGLGVAEKVVFGAAAAIIGWVAGRG